MRDIENTAVNDLIAQASGGRRAPSAGMAVIDEGPPGDPDPDAAQLTLPVGMPVAAPFEARRATSPYPMPAVQRAPAALATPVAPMPPVPPPSMAPEFLETASPRRLYELASQVDHERLVPTFQMRRGDDARRAVGKLVFPIAVLVSIGIVVGAYVAFGGDRGATRELAAPASTPAPVATTTVTAAPAAARPADPPAAAVASPIAPAPASAAAAPELVTVRIDSVPPGATVMLVDRGRTQLVGDTPVDTALDPSRDYDLVFTSASAPPHVEHFDPRTSRHVEVALGAPEAAEPAPRRVERAPADRAPAEPPPLHTSRPRPERAERTPDARSDPRTEARAEARTDAPAGQGTLMISAKPPCEIVIDGRTTGLTTPQRAIALPAGGHRITLVNSEKSIRKVVSVQIVANTTAKIIEDLMP